MKKEGFSVGSGKCGQGRTLAQRGTPDGFLMLWRCCGVDRDITESFATCFGAPVMFWCSGTTARVRAARPHLEPRPHEGVSEGFNVFFGRVSGFQGYTVRGGSADSRANHVFARKINLFSFFLKNFRKKKRILHSKNKLV